jgi:hypothetical protein
MKTKSSVQIVQVSDTHPFSDGQMYVGKDGKLHPLIVVKGRKCKCKRHKDYHAPWYDN